MTKNNKNSKLYAVNLKSSDVVTAKWLRDKTVKVQSHIDHIYFEIERREASISKTSFMIVFHSISLPFLWKRKLKQDGNASITPPQLAKFIIYLLIPKNNREAILGDLEEDFHKAHREFGLSKAKFLYCAQVLRSIWPIIGGAVSKLIKSSIKLFIATR